MQYGPLDPWPAGPWEGWKLWDLSQKTWRTAAPGGILQARTPAPQDIELWRELLGYWRDFCKGLAIAKPFCHPEWSV